MRRLLGMAAVVAAVIAAPGLAEAPPPTPNPFFTALRAARAELARGNLEAARAGFLTVDSTAGGLPSAIWSLAQIAARRGDRDEAIRRLEEFAAMGLARSVERDTTFAALGRDDARLAPIAARLAANGAPRGTAVAVHTLPDASLLAEDIAYDARTRTFYVSSIHRRKVVAIDARGAARDFVSSSQDGIWGVYGLALDAARGELWGSMAAGPAIERYEPADSGRTAIVCWETTTGKLLRRVEFPADGRPHVLGDITLAADGTLYATESIGGGLYRLRRGAASLETLAPPGTFGSPQMPVSVGDGRVVWVADYPRGIVALDIDSLRVANVAKPRDLAAAGIDGLYAAPGGWVGVQNGTLPPRVLWLSRGTRTSAVVGWQVLEQGTPLLGDPNHGVVVGHDFYFLGRSGWDRVNSRDEFETPPGAEPPVILRLALPRTAGSRPGAWIR